MSEIWKDIPGFEGWYQISNLGRVKSLSRTVDYGTSSVRTQKEKILQPRVGGPVVAGKQYHSVILYRNRYREQHKVHRLVGGAFCHKPNGCEVINHLDNDPTNNAATNLEWTTVIGNNKHRHTQGRSKGPAGDAHGQAKLSSQLLVEIKNLLNAGNLSQQVIADRFGVHQSHVSRIKLGKAWACQA